MKVTNSGKELRRRHIAALSDTANVELNFREARAINDLDREAAWRQFLARWRRSRAEATSRDGDSWAR